MTTPSPYNSQGWRARQQKAALRNAHQEKMTALRAERHRMFEEQTGGKPVAETVESAPVESPVQESPAEAPVPTPAPVTDETPAPAADEAPVEPEAETTSDESTAVEEPAAPKGRKKG